MNRKLASYPVAALALLGMGLGVMDTASACSTAAWTAVTGDVVAGGPTDADVAKRDVKKYVGSCGLKAGTSGSNFVAETAQHSAEGGAAPYRARFFVFTGVTGAAVSNVFQALDADSSGNPVVTVAYDPTEANFDFLVNGTTRSTTAGSAPLNRWVTVEFVYQANTAFSAKTRTLGEETVLASPQTAGAATIEAVQMGLLSGGGAGNFHFDEFEASRAASAGSGQSGAFTMRCRGDANGSGTITAGDRAAITAEIGGTPGAGATDCNESGSITAGDRACVTALIGNLATCS